MPEAYGTLQTMSISGLEDDTLYYVALKTIDDRGNASMLSNLASGKTDDVAAPNAISTPWRSRPWAMAASFRSRAQRLAVPIPILGRPPT